MVRIGKALDPTFVRCCGSKKESPNLCKRLSHKRKITITKVLLIEKTIRGQSNLSIKKA